MVNGILNTLVALLIGGATLNFNFAATDAAGKDVYNGNGTVISYEEKYVMETDEVIVVSDGDTKWIFQKGIDELIIQGVEEGASVMDNPFAVLLSKDSNYSVQGLSPDENSIPRKIILTAKTGAVYTIGIEGYSKLSSPDDSLFTFDISKYSDIVVTDMR